MVSANTVAFLNVPVKRTVWTLEIGTVTLTMVCQRRPVTPESFRDLDPRKRDLLNELTETLDRNHRDHPFGENL